MSEKKYWQEDEWIDMPEFVQENKQAIKRVAINFESEEDMTKFNEVTGLNITMKTKGVFFPLQKSKKKEYRYTKNTSLKYPIYVISKGRWEKRLTINALEEMSIPYKVIVEPEEYNNYLKYVSAENILVLPENFSRLGQGSIPVRNWVWEYSIKSGDEKHWILDDNISGFERLNRNERVRVKNGSMFRAAEDFVDRYENIAFAGFEYRQFGGGARRPKPPFKTNYRVYSCTLIRNDLPYRWRGKFNEDTDICIRALKDGWVTVTFNCFLQNKIGTMSMKGGNTDSIYDKTDNRKEFAESLKKQHTDIVEVVWRYNRWHHEVDYSSFQNNKLIKKKNIILGEKVNNYGMELV